MILDRALVSVFHKYGTTRFINNCDFALRNVRNRLSTMKDNVAHRMLHFTRRHVDCRDSSFPRHYFTLSYYPVDLEF